MSVNKKCLFDGNEYIVNKRYFKDDALEGFYIREYWNKKKECFTYHKYKCIRQAVTKSGRKRTTLRLVMDKIKNMDDNKIDSLYAFLKNMNI